MLVSPDEEPGAAGDAEPAVSLRSLLASLLLPCCGGVPGEPSAEEKLRQLKQSPLLRRARPQWWLLSTADHADGAEARQRRHLRVQRWLAAGAEHGTDSVDAADDAAAAAVAAGSCYASFAAGFVEEMTTDARHATLSGCGETLRELLSSAVHEGQLSAAAVAEFDAAFDAALKLYAAQPLRFLQTLRQGAGPARRGELREHYLTLAETGGGSEGGGGRGGGGGEDGCLGDSDRGDGGCDGGEAAAQAGASAGGAGAAGATGAGGVVVAESEDRGRAVHSARFASLALQGFHEQAVELWYAVMLPRHAVERGEECAVCMEPLAATTELALHAAALCCDHLVCADCWGAWSHREPTCPLCRTPYLYRVDSPSLGDDGAVEMPARLRERIDRALERSVARHRGRANASRRRGGVGGSGRGGGAVD